MPKRTKYKFSIEGKPFYPHIKLTRESFPRILITRIVDDDDAEYFGAFLNRTNARMLLDFLNRTFRLRSCDIEIDGSFNYPCTMHYKSRCIAPCVSDLAPPKEYAEMVRLVRLFLLNDRSLFGSVLSSKIDDASSHLDFESAAKWRDILAETEAYWADSRRSVWLAETSDTITFRITEAGIDLILISQKGRRVLGERTFSFNNAVESDVEDAISDVISQFYRFHVPKEIRVPLVLPMRMELEKMLHERFGRRVRIVLLTEKNRKISTELAIYRSSAELDVKRAAVPSEPRKLLQSLKREFRLSYTPKRITAIDVAHISGIDQVAAAVSWVNGRMDADGSLYWLSDSGSEIGSIQRFVKRLVTERFADEPQLLLIDGGAAQLNAAIGAKLPNNISLVSAVKPTGEHESIAYFLTAVKQRIDFDIFKEAHRLLQILRDDAHTFANEVHRDIRDYANYYRMAEILPSLMETERRKLLNAFLSVEKISMATEADLGGLLTPDRLQLAVVDLERFRMGRNRTIRPLVVPTRLQEADGAAEDLRPIQSTSRRF